MSYGTRFEEALAYACDLHRGQYRKGTQVPYITHLLAVASLVGEAGGTEDEVIAGLLHDAVEDQGGAVVLAVIRDRFGDRVADIVLECSDTDLQPKPPWGERKTAYLAHLADASPSALLVSCADKLHNARAVLSDYETCGDTLWARFNAGKESQLWYYRSLVDAFEKAAAPPRLLEPLRKTVEELERLASQS